MRKNIKLYITFLFMLLLLFISCTSRKKINIGFVASLSGDNSHMGVSSKYAAYLAVEEINNNGGIKGRQIKLIVKDNGDIKEKALEVGETLINKGSVAVIGYLTSTLAVAVSKLFNERQRVLISPTASTTELSNTDDYFFRVISTMEQNSKTASEYLIKANCYKTTIIIDISNRNYSETWLETFKNYYNTSGGTVIREVNFNSKTEQLRYDLLSKMLTDKETASIVIVANSINTALLCQHIKKDGYTGNILSSGWGMNNDFIRYAGSYGEGVIFVHPFDYNNTSKDYTDFRRRYINKFNIEPLFSAAYTYEAFMILKEALQDIEYTDNTTLYSKKLKEALRNKEHNGLQQKFKIDKYGDVIRENHVFSVKDGAFKRISIDD